MKQRLLNKSILVCLWAAASNQTFLIDCHPLDSGSNVNSSIILHTVDDILQQLEIKRENFSLFLTDAARYMSLAGKALKELYPSLMYITCVAHLLHNCAMRVRADFKNIDEIIATTKATTIKNKNRKKDFHDAGLPSPPDPVITRWATWLRAALYYSENLPAVRTIVNNWTSAGLLVSRAKHAINVANLVTDLVKINQYVDSSSQRRVLRRKCLDDNRSIRTAEEYAIR